MNCFSFEKINKGIKRSFRWQRFWVLVVTCKKIGWSYKSIMEYSPKAPAVAFRMWYVELVISGLNKLRSLFGRRFEYWRLISSRHFKIDIDIDISWKIVLLSIITQKDDLVLIFVTGCVLYGRGMSNNQWTMVFSPLFCPTSLY